MLPQTPEQGGVATRVAQLGAGKKLEKTDAEEIRKAVEEVLANSSYKENAARIAEGFRSCAGAAGAADKILSVCKG